MAAIDAIFAPNKNSVDVSIVKKVTGYSMGVGYDEEHAILEDYDSVNQDTQRSPLMVM